MAAIMAQVLSFYRLLEPYRVEIKRKDTYRQRVIMHDGTNKLHCHSDVINFCIHLHNYNNNYWPQICFVRIGSSMKRQILYILRSLYAHLYIYSYF